MRAIDLFAGAGGVKMSAHLAWERYAIENPNRGLRAWTPVRLRYAAAAVKKEAEAMPLFPELRRFQSVEDRVAMVSEEETGFRRRMRGVRSDSWRRARAEFRALPRITQLGLRKYWNESQYPRDPLYFRQLIKDCRRGRSPWSWLREQVLLSKHRPGTAFRFIAP